jgi:hypothetical protein
MEDNVIIRALFSIAMVAAAVIAALNSKAPMKTPRQSAVVSTADALAAHKSVNGAQANDQNL